MMTHSRLPWKLWELNIENEGGVTIAVVHDSSEYPFLDEEHGAEVDAEAEANAAFIVRAVNAHDALVEALGEAYAALIAHGLGSASHNETADLILLIGKALVKAKGETQ